MADERDTGRGPRAQQEAQRRRRRGDETLDGSRKLPIPPEVQAMAARENLQLRWVNDEGNRMHRMTVQDDYDKVSGVDPVPIGTAEDGKPILAHLCSKPRDFWQEDQAKLEARRSGVEDALLRNPNEAAAQGKTAQLGGESYVTSDTKIRRGNQVLE